MPQLAVLTDCGWLDWREVKCDCRFSGLMISWLMPWVSAVMAFFHARRFAGGETEGICGGIREMTVRLADRPQRATDGRVAQSALTGWRERGGF